jgi:hypothetical protein
MTRARRRKGSLGGEHFHQPEMQTKSGPLGFIDKTSVNKGMYRLRGRARCGMCLKGTLPFGK